MATDELTRCLNEAKAAFELQRVKFFGMDRDLKVMSEELQETDEGVEEDLDRIWGMSGVENEEESGDDGYQERDHGQPRFHRMNKLDVPCCYKLDGGPCDVRDPRERARFQSSVDRRFEEMPDRRNSEFSNRSRTQELVDEREDDGPDVPERGSGSCDPGSLPLPPTRTPPLSPRFVTEDVRWPSPRRKNDGKSNDNSAGDWECDLGFEDYVVLDRLDVSTSDENPSRFDEDDPFDAPESILRSSPGKIFDAEIRNDVASLSTDKRRVGDSGSRINSPRDNRKVSSSTSRLGGGLISAASRMLRSPFGFANQQRRPSDRLIPSRAIEPQQDFSHSQAIALSRISNQKLNRAMEKVSIGGPRPFAESFPRATAPLAHHQARQDDKMDGVRRSRDAGGSSGLGIQGIDQFITADQQRVFEDQIPCAPSEQSFGLVKASFMPDGRVSLLGDTVPPHHSGRIDGIANRDPFRRNFKDPIEPFPSKLGSANFKSVFQTTKALHNVTTSDAELARLASESHKFENHREDYHALGQTADERFEQNRKDLGRIDPPRPLSNAFDAIRERKGVNTRRGGQNRRRSSQDAFPDSDMEGPRPPPNLRAPTRILNYGEGQQNRSLSREGFLISQTQQESPRKSTFSGVLGSGADQIPLYHPLTGEIQPRQPGEVVNNLAAADTLFGHLHRDSVDPTRRNAPTAPNTSFNAALSAAAAQRAMRYDLLIKYSFQQRQSSETQLNPSSVGASQPEIQVQDPSPSPPRRASSMCESIDVQVQGRSVSDIADEDEDTATHHMNELRSSEHRDKDEDEDIILVE